MNARGERMTGEWFDIPDPDTGEVGLRFACTMCGNCCSGPPGYVLVSDAECDALAVRMGVGRAAFIDRYTEMTSHGRSLVEREGPRGFDCIFLDRERVPGRAVCGVYEDRPAQCRSWPFWPELLRSRDDWIRARRTCPGIDTGRLHAPQQVRVIRDRHAR
ncbi:MAG TPA: YkgJ family cysteine cluster protein [Phycisphaerales bacterium]|nr:YkgJ family cysteine cluster protein [Phycisphaerales bacterium]